MQQLMCASCTVFLDLETRALGMVAMVYMEQESDVFSP